MQTSQKLKITTPANENQADFGRKDTKIKADLIRSKCSEESRFEFQILVIRACLGFSA